MPTKTTQTTKTSLPVKSTKKEPFLNFENVSKAFPTPKWPYVVLEDVNLKIQEGEMGEKRVNWKIGTLSNSD